MHAVECWYYFPWINKFYGVNTEKITKKFDGGKKNTMTKKI